MIFNFLLLASWFSFAQTSPAAGTSTVTIPVSEYNKLTNGENKSCMQTMLENTSKGMAATLQAQTAESNMLMGLSQKYYEREQQCGNDLAEVKMQLDQAKADYEAKAMNLPNEIEQQQLDYQSAVLAVQQDCEKSSGAAFVEWKKMASQGVITPERGGPMALFSRNENINKYQKLYYDDCLASKTNVKRLQILSRKLSLNIQKLKTAVESASMKLAALSKTLSFKQGVIASNCMKAKKQLDYQAALARNNASATKFAVQMNNFMNMLNGVNTCMAGPGTSVNDSTGTSSTSTN